MALPVPHFQTRHIKTTHTKPYASLSAEKLQGSATGLTVLVTGAGRGIGQKIAACFAEAGASTVILASRSVHQLQETARAIEAFGAKAIVVETDVTSQDSVGALFASIDKEGLVVDVAALNAGATEPWAPLHESEPAAWLNTWDVQIKGLYFPARELLKRHVQSEHKKPLKLLVTTSIVLNFAFPGQSAYGPSKSAQQRIVEMIHADYQNQSVQVFGYHPGTPATDLVRASGASQEMMDLYFNDDPLLSGRFAVWLATTPAAAKLSGKFASANWDVDELLQGIRDGGADGDGLTMRLE